MCVSPVIRSLWCVYDVYTNPKGWWKQIRMYWASDRLEIIQKFPLGFFRRPTFTAVLTGTGNPLVETFDLFFATVTFLLLAVVWLVWLTRHIIAPCWWENVLNCPVMLGVELLRLPWSFDYLLKLSLPKYIEGKFLRPYAHLYSSVNLNTKSLVCMSYARISCLTQYPFDKKIKIDNLLSVKINRFSYWVWYIA